MSVKHSLIFSLLILLSTFSKAEDSVLHQLTQLELVSIEKISTLSSFEVCFKIFIKQPIDHHDLSKGYFNQKFYLSHKGVEKPMVFFINGYISSSNRANEWSEHLDANQLYVEHRFFGQSKPDSISWTTLNLKNVTADLHRIKEVLGKVYTNSWLSTGISKGGLTAVAYKYYFPNDVKATVAHSTSLKPAACDTTFFNYIDSLNNVQGCGDRLLSFQRLLLRKKTEILPLLQSHLSTSHQRTYDKLGLDGVFETAVREIPFSVWQHASGCKNVQIVDTAAITLFEALRYANHDWFLTDDVIDQLKGHHYQAQTELGYYCYPSRKLKDLLSESKHRMADVVHSNGEALVYSNQLMLAMRKWLMQEGNNIIYISGGNDPYTLYHVQPTSKTNSIGLILENKNHNQTQFSDLDHELQELVLATLKKWLE